jgi:hypothetical protein
MPYTFFHAGAACQSLRTEWRNRSADQACKTGAKSEPLSGLDIGSGAQSHRRILLARQEKLAYLRRIRRESTSR